MATAKIRKQVYWQEDERVDVPDITAAQTFARLRSQDIVQFLAGRAPRAGHTGRTWMPYAVWALNGAGITFEPATDNRIKIGLGLRLVLTGGDTDDAGDPIEVAEETIKDDFCPTVGTPLLLLMARVSTSLLSGDAADRVFYKTADGTEETRNEPTTQRRDINWEKVDATDDAAITALEATGYQWVAELDYNGGAHQVSEWYYLLPESEVGGGALTESVLAAVWALKRGIEAAYGGGKAWTATPDNTLEDDELHADDLFADDFLAVGRTSIDDSTGEAALILPASGYVMPGGGTRVGGVAFIQAPDGSVIATGDPKEIATLHRVFGTGWNGLTSAIVLQLGTPSNGSVFELSTLNGCDIAFGRGRASLRAMKDAAGNYVLKWRDGQSSTSADDWLVLRSDKRIESTNLTRVVRDLPLEDARPFDADTVVGSKRVTITHDAGALAVVLRVVPLYIGDLAKFANASHYSVIPDEDGNSWARPDGGSFTSWPQVYCKETGAEQSRLVADLSSVQWGTGGRDVFVVFSNGYRLRITHDAAAATHPAVYFDGGVMKAGFAGLADVSVAQESAGLWSLVSSQPDQMSAKTWRWNAGLRRWETQQNIAIADAAQRVHTLRRAIPRSYAGVAGVRNERLVSLTCDAQAGTATTLRLYLYEDGDSVGTDGGSNDYVEWSPTQTGEKTISVNAAALDADGTTSQIVAVWVIQSGDPPVAYVRQCRVTSDVYLLPH